MNNELRTMNKVFARIVSLLVAEVFLFSSVLPAWALEPTSSHLRPQDAKEGGIGKTLSQELRSTKEGGNKPLEPSTTGWMGKKRRVRGSGALSERRFAEAQQAVKEFLVKHPHPTAEELEQELHHWHYLLGSVPHEGTVYYRSLKKEQKTKELLARLIPLWDNPTDVFELAAWTHHEYLKISPFRDANHRRAILLMNFFLQRAGFSPFLITDENIARYSELTERKRIAQEPSSYKEFRTFLEEELSVARDGGEVLSPLTPEQEIRSIYYDSSTHVFEIPLAGFGLEFADAQQHHGLTIQEYGPFVNAVENFRRYINEGKSPEEIAEAARVLRSTVKALESHIPSVADVLPYFPEESSPQIQNKLETMAMLIKTSTKFWQVFVRDPERIVTVAKALKLLPAALTSTDPVRHAVRNGFSIRFDMHITPEATSVAQFQRQTIQLIALGMTTSLLNRMQEGKLTLDVSFNEARALTFSAQIQSSKPLYDKDGRSERAIEAVRKLVAPHGGFVHEEDGDAPRVVVTLPLQSLDGTAARASYALEKEKGKDASEARDGGKGRMVRTLSFLMGSLFLSDTSTTVNTHVESSQVNPSGSGTQLAPAPSLDAYQRIHLATTERAKVEIFVKELLPTWELVYRGKEFEPRIIEVAQAISPQIEEFVRELNRLMAKPFDNKEKIGALISDFNRNYLIHPSIGFYLSPYITEYAPTLYHIMLDVPTDLVGTLVQINAYEIFQREKELIEGEEVEIFYIHRVDTFPEGIDVEPLGHSEPNAPFVTIHMAQAEKYAEGILRGIRGEGALGVSAQLLKKVFPKAQKETILGILLEVTKHHELRHKEDQRKGRYQDLDGFNRSVVVETAAYLTSITKHSNPRASLVLVANEFLLTYLSEREHNRAQQDILNRLSALVFEKGFLPERHTIHGGSGYEDFKNDAAEVNKILSVLVQLPQDQMQDLVQTALEEFDARFSPWKRGVTQDSGAAREGGGKVTKYYFVSENVFVIVTDLYGQEAPLHDVHSALDWIDRHDEEIQRRFAALSSERPKTLKKYEKIPSSTIMTALRKAGKIDPDVTDEKFFQDWIRAAGARDLAKRVAPILEAISERFTNPLQAARWSFEHLDEIRQLNWEGLGKEKGTLSLETVLDALWVAQKLPEGTTREEMKSWGRLAGAFDLAIRISPIFKKIEQPFRNARSAIEWIRDHHDEIVQENIRALARRGNGYLAYGTILAALWADGKLHPAVDVHKLKGWMQQAAAAEYARAEQEMIQETIREAWSQTPPSERQKLHDRHRLYAALWNSASHRFLRRDVPTQRISQGYFEKVMPFAMRWYGERFLSELGSGTSAQEGGAKAFRAYLEEHQYPGGPIQMIVDAYKGGKQVVVLSDPHPDTSGTTYSQFLEALVVRLSREVGLKKLLIEYHPRAVEEELLPLIREDKETWERFWNFVRAEDPDEPSQELFKQHFPSHWLPMLRAADARGVEIFGFNPRGHLGFSGWLREEGLPEEGGKTEERFTEEILNRLDLTDSTERVLVISGLHHVAKTEALKRMGNLLTRNSGLKVTTVLVHIGWRRVGLKRRFLPGDYLLPLLRRAKIPVVAVHHTALSPIGNLQVFKEWIISTLLDAPVEGTPRDRIVARLKDFDMLVYFDSQDAITQYVETAAKDGGAARDGGEKVDYRPQTSDKRHQERELEERGISRTENISEPSSDAGIDPLRQEPVLEELLHRRYRVPSSYSPSFSGQNHNPSPNATKATHTKASLEPPDNLKNRSPANAAAASILNRSINVFERSPRLPSESDGFAISNTSIPNPDESVKVYKLSVSDDSGAAQDGGEQYSQELLASLQQIVGATPQKPFALPKELVGYASRLHAFASDMPLDEQWSLVEKFFTTLFRAIRSEDALRQQTAITIWKLLEPHFSSQAQVAAKGYAEEVGVWKEAIDAIVGPEEGAVQRRVAALSEEIRERMRHRWDKGNHNEVVGQEEEKLREIVVLKRKGWAPHASIKLSLANVFSEVATGLFGSIPPERRGPKINLTEEEFSTLLRAKAYYHMAWEWRPGWWGGSLTGDSDFRLSKINDILNKAPKDQLEAVRSRLKQEGFTDEELGTARDGGNHTSTELVRWLNGHPREIEKRLIEMMDEPEVQRMLQMLQSLGLSPEHPLQFRYTDAESLDYAGMILLEEDPVGLPIGLPSTWFRRPYHESLRILKHELTHIILFRNKMVDPQRTLQLFQYIKTIDPTSKQKAAHDLLDDLLDYEVVRFQLENNFPNAANALLNDIFPGGEEEKKKRETIRDYHKTHPMPAVDQFRKATLFYTSWYVEGILPFEHLQQPGHEGLRRRFETRFRDVLTEGDLTTIHTIIQEILVPALLDHTWPQKFQEIFEDFYHRVYTYFPSFKPPTPMQDGSDGAAQDGSTKKEREKEEKREAFVIKESEKLLATPLPEDETALFRLRETLSAVERSISGSFGRQFIERWDDPKPIQTSPEREIVETYGEQLQARIQEIDQKLKLEHLTPMGFVDETFAREAVRSYEEFLKASLPQDPHVLQALLVLLITTIAELNQTVGDIIRSGRHTSDNAQIKAKLAALSGGADFKGISQRLNEKLTLVLKTLDHKKSARDGGSLLSERLVSFFAGSWTNYIKALKDNKDVADASRALEHAAGNTSHETRELAEQLIRYSSQLDEPDIREELFQMWDFYNQHVLIPNNLYGILPIGYDDEKNWYFYGSILYKIEYQEIHRINDKKKVEVLFGRRFSNPTEANIPQAGHSLDEMPVVFIDIDQIQETVSAFRDTLEGNLVPYGIPEVAEWIRNTYRDWNDEQILEEVKNNTVIHELAHQAFDEMKYRYIQEDGFGISPKVWRQMQLYESDLIEQEVGAYLVEMALIRDPASVLEILIRPFLEGRPEEESYVGQYLFNRLSGKKVGDPWVERGKRDGIIRLFTDLTASPLLGQRADQILREDFSNFNLPTFVKLDDQGGAARDGGSQEKKLAALKRALKERERKGYSNHPAAFFRGEHVDRALYRLALDLERKHGVTLLPRKRVSFDLDHPDTVVRVQRALKKREKKGWSNTPGQLQKGEHADPPLYDWAIAVEERNKITLLPRKRVSFDLTDPDTLERVQNALKEREKKWGEKANSPGQLQKGEHPDYSVYNWAVTLEKKHGIILLSRERVSRSWDTLEGWRNYIDERIATGKKITSSGLANAVSAGPLKKLRQIEREQGVQLILRRQGGLPEFGAFSAQVGQLVWDRFHPAKKIDPEKGAREIVQVLQSRAWQEQLMLLSLFNRHDRLKDRTQAFLKTKVGQKWLKELNEPIRKEVVHMVLWTTQKEHLQATYRVLAWITLAPHGSEEMLKQIQSSEKLRNRWPLFLETELGQRVYSSLKDTERVSEQKVALTADEEELLAYLRSQKKPVSPSRMAQEVHLSERNGSVAAVEELVRNLERKKIPISRTEAGSLFLTKTQSRSKAIRSEGVKDGAARQWIPSPRISSIHPSRDLLLTTYP